jgi:hypothetical protein
MIGKKMIGVDMKENNIREMRKKSLKERKRSIESSEGEHCEDRVLRRGAKIIHDTINDVNRVEAHFERMKETL